MNKSYYAVIPANIRYDKRINPNAKLLYGEITALCNEKGYCWATNSYFADLYNVSKVTISKWINQLKEIGYISSEIQYKEGTKEIANRYLRIVNDPIKENFNTPIKENFNTPIKEKFKGNTTVLNNTTNSSSSKTFADVSDFYQQNFGPINSFMGQELGAWCDDLSPELVIESMKRTLGEQKKWNYAKGILKNWVNNNLTTIDDIQAAEKVFRKKGEKSHASDWRSDRGFIEPDDDFDPRDISL